jgi:hypothetical protein
MVLSDVLYVALGVLMFVILLGLIWAIERI